MRRSEVLRSSIEARRAVVVPGCHDALSARVVESCGFEAVQVSGLGLAASMLAAPDVGLVPLQAVFEATWNIVQAVDVPVMTRCSPSVVGTSQAARMFGTASTERSW
jgi:methylisocitrate lyase